MWRFRAKYNISSSMRVAAYLVAHILLSAHMCAFRLNGQDKAPAGQPECIICFLTIIYTIYSRNSHTFDQSTLLIQQRSENMNLKTIFCPHKAARNLRAKTLLLQDPRRWRVHRSI